MNKQALIDYLDEIAPILTETSRAIWARPEIASQETFSSQLMRDILRRNGFSIIEIDGMPTAFYAEYGTGKPVLAVLGEYDALPGLSQRCSSQREAAEENGPGHGCGHNLLGTGALGAALALKKLLEDTGRSGTVRYYGCPAEETLSGKPDMVARHAFDGCDAALSWHPMIANIPYEELYLAMTSVKFYFKGKTAHAAASPHLGRSALDAVELMNVGANYLREHITDKARMHYTTDSCGIPPNVVPDRAESWYYVRAPHLSDVEEILERLKKVAQGAAMMTETTMECKVIGRCCEMLPNQAMEKLTRANMESIGAPVFSEEENRFAAELLESIPQAQLQKERAVFGYDPNNAPPLCEDVGDYAAAARAQLTGSSDSGDVSYLMPMNLFTTACGPLGAAVHSWHYTACAGGSIGEKGMLYAAKVLAGVGFDLLTDPEALRCAQREFTIVSAAHPYTPFVAQ